MKKEGKNKQEVWQDKKEFKEKLITTLIILIVGLLIFAIIILSLIPTQKNLDNFAKCLTEKDVAFYGADWCPHCITQKEMFGESFKYITYIECYTDGENKTKLCTEALIESYPTWINFISGERYEGVQTLQELENISGCKLP